MTQAQTQQHGQLSHTPIAIVGISALFPQARNLREYWCNILNKVDCITDVPTSNWDAEDYYDSDPKFPDKTYSRRGGFLPTVDFNPLEFGLPPDSLEAIDSAQLLSLMVARDALEDAGYGKSDETSRETTGVILGASGLWKAITPLTSRLQYPIWRKVLKNSGLSEDDIEKIVEKIKLAYVPWQENSFPGMLTNVVAGRITNRLDLGGTNCTVDAACASSLAALKMAMGELIERRCDLMVTGGVDTDNSILNYMCFSKTPAFSKKDHLSPFDADSDGMMVGEGIGMMVLKRLEDAERDGDRIYAVIKGVGTSSDGRYKSIYAPRPEGQMLSLRRAYENAGCSPATVGLLEAHGTGTPRGDHCEFSALKSVFGEDSAQKQHIALGSVKSQIGHTKAAAGSASLIKAALALHHKILPPTINVSEPNPQFDIEASPFYINTEVRPWVHREDSPRRAGVSSFGFGGTNFHVVLEEYDRASSQPYRLHDVPQAVLLWAEDAITLEERCRQVVNQLKTEAAEAVYRDLAIAYTATKIPPETARLGMVVSSPDELKAYLETSLALLSSSQAESWTHPKGIYYRQQGMALSGRVVALFPGQGAQYLNMGHQLAVNFPPVLEAYQQLDNLFTRDQQPPLSEVVFPKPTFGEATKERDLEMAEALQSTRHAQPAIGALSAGMYKILHEAGFQTDFMAGHSFGEITALWAAQVLSDDDYFQLIKARGEAMAHQPHVSPCERGTMISVQGDRREIERVCDTLSHVTVANYNAPDQVVLSGSKPELAAVQQVFNNLGYSITPLPVSAAFHSPFIRHASEPFAQAIDAVTFHPPTVDVFSNITGEKYPSDPEAIKSILKEHLLKPVHFEREIENIYAQGGDCFVEIGPRRILTGLVERILGDRPHLAIALNPSRQRDSDFQLRQAVVQLQVAGLSLGNIDVYQQAVPPPKAPADQRLTIRLNGNNYVSDKTKQAFAEALLDGHQASLSEIVHTPVEVSSVPLPIAKTMPDSTSRNESTPTVAENLLTQFYSHQTEILKVHDRYLKDQAACSQAFLKALQQLSSGLSPSAADEPQAAEPIVVSEAVQVAAPIPTSPPVSVTSSPAPMATPASPIPAAAASRPSVSIPNPIEQVVQEKVVQATVVQATVPDAAKVDEMATLLIASVSEKTGYPAEMLSLDMDLEADLGVDSIKRVEIMGRVQDTLSDLPRLSTDDIGELRTLQQITDYLVEQLGKKKLVEPALSR